MRLKHLFIIFVPTFLLLFLFVFIRITQYQSTDTKKTEQNKNSTNTTIPIFPEDPILGQKKAPKTIVVFADFGCEPCKNEFLNLVQLQNEFPQKIKIVWKSLSVTKFPIDTEQATSFAACAHEQNAFAPFAALLFENQTMLTENTLSELTQIARLDEEKMKTCVKSQKTTANKEKTKELAKILGIQAVPALFVDNTQIQTPKSIEEWKQVLSL